MDVAHWWSHELVRASLLATPSGVSIYETMIALCDKEEHYPWTRRWTSTVGCCVHTLYVAWGCFLKNICIYYEKAGCFLEPNLKPSIYSIGCYMLSDFCSAVLGKGLTILVLVWEYLKAPSTKWGDSSEVSLDTSFICFPQIKRFSPAWCPSLVRGLVLGCSEHSDSSGQLASPLGEQQGQPSCVFPCEGEFRFSVTWILKITEILRNWDLPWEHSYKFT